MAQRGRPEVAPNPSSGGATVWALVEGPARTGTSRAGAVLAGVTEVGGATGARLLALVDGLPAGVDIVVLTDGAALTVAGDRVGALMSELDADADGVATVRPVTDALKRVGAEFAGGCRLEGDVARGDLVEPTWPQVVRRHALRAAVAGGGEDLHRVMPWLVRAGYRIRLAARSTTWSANP